MRLDELTCALEYGHTVIPDGYTYLAANGEPFETFVCSATVHKDMPVDSYDGALCDLMLSMIWHRFGGKGGEFPQLYWRKRPEFETHKEAPENCVTRRLRCRVLISRNPPKELAA